MGKEAISNSLLDHATMHAHVGRGHGPASRRTLGNKRRAVVPGASGEGPGAGCLHIRVGFPQPPAVVGALVFAGVPVVEVGWVVVGVRVSGTHHLAAILVGRACVVASAAGVDGRHRRCGPSRSAV